MSTKVTWLYGFPEKDGRENDYHLYFDYKDFDVHLEIHGKEVWLPPKLRKELEEVFDIYFAVTDILARILAHAYVRGDVEAYVRVVSGIGATAMGRSIYKELYEEGKKVLNKKDYDPLDDIIDRIEWGDEDE